MATWNNQNKQGAGRTWAQATVSWGVSLNTWSSLVASTWSALTKNTSTFTTQNKTGIIEWADTVFLWDDPVLSWDSTLNVWNNQNKN